jgi:hypothetical protein
MRSSIASIFHRIDTGTVFGKNPIYPTKADIILLKFYLSFSSFLPFITIIYTFLEPPAGIYEGRDLSGIEDIVIFRGLAL